MVHARRKLYELAATSKAPIAAEAVRRIDRLFAVERDVAGLSAEARLAVRRERSAPILADLEPWLLQQQERLSRKSEVGKAIAYTTRRWEALTRFMGDGSICLTNNAAERALRGVAVGRRNWTFAGSEQPATRCSPF
jgi:transposase